ncbi:hypothetical protein ACFQ07_09565, partial [Actinomadura adrarensis]
DAPTERRSAVHVHAPFTGFFHITYPDGVQHILVKAITPIDDHRCRLLQVSLRSDSEDDRPAADIVAFNARVADEDREIMETMPAEFPVGRHELVHIATDRLSLGYRTLLADITAGKWKPSPPSPVHLRT